MNNEMEFHQAVGQRLASLRNAIRLTRKDIETRYGIRSPSLRSWETGNRTLQRPVAEKLVSIFKKHGLMCTVDWVLTGEGLDPLETAAQSTEEACILREILTFESCYPDNTIVVQAEDNCMAPWIQKGDYVGGVFVDKKNPLTFRDRICIVKTREFGVQTRVVQETQDPKLYNLVSTSQKGSLLNVEPVSIAVVLFLRKFQENTPKENGIAPRFLDGQLSY